MGAYPSKKSLTVYEYKDLCFPKEICPDEEILRVKSENLLKIKERIECKYKSNTNLFSFVICLRDLVILDIEMEEIKVDKNRLLKDNVNITDSYSDTFTINVPKRYENGFDRIISDNEVLDIFKSIIKTPFVFEIGFYNEFVARFVHQPI